MDEALGAYVASFTLSNAPIPAVSQIIYNNSNTLPLASELNMVDDRGFPLVLMLMFSQDRRVAEQILSKAGYNLLDADDQTVYNLLWYEAFFPLPDRLAEVGQLRADLSDAYQDESSLLSGATLNSVLKQYLCGLTEAQLEPFMGELYTGPRGRAEYIYSIVKLTRLPISDDTDRIVTVVDTEALRTIKNWPSWLVFIATMYYCAGTDMSAKMFREYYDYNLPPYRHLTSILISEEEMKFFQQYIIKP